jgi:2-dehydropantoate 2-reductase
MRIAVLGAGGVGSVVAGMLAQTAHDVVLVARGEHFAAIQAGGLAIEGAVAAVSRPRLVEHAGALRAVDVLLVVTKTYDTLEALRDVDPAEVTAVASLQNGVLKDRLLAGHFGSQKVIGCATMVGGERLGPGRVRYTLAGDTFFGESDGAASPRVEALAQAFREAGLGVQVARDIASIEWTKQVLQAANGPLAAITRLPLHAIYLGPAAVLYQRIVREAAAVAAAHGVALDREQAWGGPLADLLDLDDEAGLALIRTYGERLAARGATNVRISMEKDVATGSRTELEETAGWVEREAARLGVAAPNLSFACQAVRALSAGGATP